MICGIDETLKRDFYTEMCRIQRWSVRDFKRQIDIPNKLENAMISTIRSCH